MYLQALEKDSFTVVFAGARKPAASTTLGELKVKYGDRLQLITLDVTDEASAQVNLLPMLPCLSQQSVFGQCEYDGANIDAWVHRLQGYRGSTGKDAYPTRLITC